MDPLSFLSAISSMMTIIDFTKNFAKKFINSLNMDTSTELENQVCEVIEDFKKAQEDNNDLLISSLKEIRQLSGSKKDYLKTQFENTLKEFSDSNIVQLKDSNDNQITQTTQSSSGSGDNVGGNKTTYNYGNQTNPPQDEKKNS